jgi:hypothetical protein
MCLCVEDRGLDLYGRKGSCDFVSLLEITCKVEAFNYLSPSLTSSRFVLGRMAAILV